MIFCCRALFTNARYMSFLSFSSCLILEFVAIGLEARRDGEEAEEDFREGAGCLVNSSSDGDDFEREKSMCLDARAIGPVFGGLWLN